MVADAIERGELRAELLASPLTRLQRAEERRELSARGDRTGEARDFDVELCELVVQPLRSALEHVGPRAQELEPLRERRFKDLDAEQIMLDRGEHRLIGRIERHLQVVLADGAAAKMIGRAPEERHALAAVVSRVDEHPSAARRARRKPGEQVGRLNSVRRPPVRVAVR